MSKFISSDSIFLMAKELKQYVEDNGKLPFKLDYQGTEFTTQEMQDILTYGVLYPNRNVNADTHGWCIEANGQNIIENIQKDDYLDQAQRVRNFILTNNRVPNWIRTKKTGTHVNIDLYTYCMAKILVYYKNNGRYPNYCTYDYRDMQGKKKSYSQEIFDYFVSKFGKINCIDDALEKIQGRGYGYYYNNKLSNKQTIDGLATRGGTKPNCTDIHQMAWHLGKVLGYDVRAVHVKCKGGDGHVRLDFNKGNGWFSRDFSAVADGKCISCIWCGNGTVLAYNPQWFLNDLNW